MPAAQRCTASRSGAQCHCTTAQHCTSSADTTAPHSSALHRTALRCSGRCPPRRLRRCCWLPMGATAPPELRCIAQQSAQHRTVHCCTAPHSAAPHRTGICRCRGPQETAPLLLTPMALRFASTAPQCTAHRTASPAPPPSRCCWDAAGLAICILISIGSGRNPPRRLRRCRYPGKWQHCGDAPSSWLRICTSALRLPPQGQTTCVPAQAPAS